MILNFSKVVQMVTPIMHMLDIYSRPSLHYEMLGLKMSVLFSHVKKALFLDRSCKTWYFCISDYYNKCDQYFNFLNSCQKCQSPLIWTFISKRITCYILEGTSPINSIHFVTCVRTVHCSNQGTRQKA